MVSQSSSSFGVVLDFPWVKQEEEPHRRSQEREEGLGT